MTEGNVNEQELGCALTTPSCDQGYPVGPTWPGDIGGVEWMIERGPFGAAQAEQWIIWKEFGNGR